jgi:hypothetical protein
MCILDFYVLQKPNSFFSRVIYKEVAGVNALSLPVHSLAANEWRRCWGDCYRRLAGYLLLLRHVKAEDTVSNKMHFGREKEGHVQYITLLGNL